MEWWAPLTSCWNTLDLPALKCEGGIDLQGWLQVGGFTAAGIFIAVVGAILWFRDTLRAMLVAPVRRLLIRPALIFDSQIVPPDIDVVGRAADLRAIRRLFRRRCDAVAIVADGGYGKTELAAEYARQFSRGWPWRRYRGVWRLMAGSNAAALNDLQRLMTELGQPKEADIGSAVQAAQKVLTACDGRWLIIHDNAEDAPSAEVEARLLRGSRIDNLITSRKGDWTARVAQHRLQELAPDDAVALLAQVSGHEVTADLRKLAVETIGGLPYLLVIAGAQLRVAKLAPADLIAEFGNLLTLRAQTGGYDKSAHKVLEGSLRLLSPPDGPPDPEGEDALALLRLAAFMNPDDIDEGFLVEGAKAVAARIEAGSENFTPLPEPLAGLAAQKLRRNAALTRLDQLSLTTPGQWEEAPTRRLHRTTQRVLRDGMGDAAAVQIGLVGRLGRAQFSDNVQHDTASWPRCRRLARHALAMAPRAAEAAPGDRRVAASLVHVSAMYLDLDIGDLRLVPLVRQLREGNLVAMAAAFGADSLDYATALQSLGWVLDDLGEDAAAEARLIEARDLTVNLLGPDDPRCAYDHTALGGFYWRRQRFAQAEAALRESLRLRDAPGVAGELAGGAHGNLGTLYSAWANAAPGTAEAVRHRALALYHLIEGLGRTRAALGDLALSTATRHNNLHVEYRTLGEAGSALAHGLRAAAISLAMAQAGTIGADHPRIAEDRGYLAITLREQGREAELDALLGAEVAALLDGSAPDITPERVPPPA